MEYTKDGPKRRRRTRRDGNESARKGLGCTNRSIRMDWFGGRKGNEKAHPTTNKIARQAPAVDA
jgi:hypothetical protein